MSKSKEAMAELMKATATEGTAGRDQAKRATSKPSAAKKAAKRKAPAKKRSTAKAKKAKATTTKRTTKHKTEPMGKTVSTYLHVSELEKLEAARQKLGVTVNANRTLLLRVGADLVSQLTAEELLEKVAELRSNDGRTTRHQG